MQDWVITSTGKIVRRDKAKPTDIIPLHVLDSVPSEINEFENILNSFPTKESAYLCRDNIIELCPIAFLEGNLPKSVTHPKSEQKVAIKPEKYSQEEFNKITRQKLIENYDVFWTNFRNLRPKDACEIYLKMARYGFSTAPQAKPVDEEVEQRKQEFKRQQTAATIADGLLDTNYDPDEDDDIMRSIPF